MHTTRRLPWMAAAAAALLAAGCSRSAVATARADERGKGSKPQDAADDTAERLVRDGRRIFRFDTFGDEAFWTDTLKLNQAVEKVPPATALAVGLKVDLDALPQAVQTALAAGQIDLNDPAVTATLLSLDAVVGVKAKVDAGRITRLGVTCALCHSTVDDAFTKGVGHRLDGWPNRDLDVGAIVGLSPDLSAVANLLGVDEATVRAVLASWGPGRFDAELFMDGKAFRPDGKTAATLLPAAFGLAGVNLHTYNGWGSVPYWNAFVANLEMHGQGTFFDPRLDDPVKFPIAARNGFGHVTPPAGQPDLVTSKLPALHFYQLSLDAPKAPKGSFDAVSAKRGEAVFAHEAKCATCHVPPLFTDPGWNMHSAEEIGIDSFQADRSPDGKYRTTPLRGLWAKMRAGDLTDPTGNGHGFYHDGRFATLLEVVNHYDQHMSLGLSDAQKADVVEYLKSL